MGLLELLEVTVSGCRWDLSPPARATGRGLFPHSQFLDGSDAFAAQLVPQTHMSRGEGRESWAQELPKLSSQCKKLGRGEKFSKTSGF